MFEYETFETIAGWAVSRAINASVAAFASPQMPTETGLTRPSIFASASI